MLLFHLISRTNIQRLLILLERKVNFIVDVMKGSIVLLVRKIDENKIMEGQIEIKMGLKEEKVHERIMTEEDFQEEIKSLDLPTFEGEELEDRNGIVQSRNERVEEQTGKEKKENQKDGEETIQPKE